MGRVCNSPSDRYVPKSEATPEQWADKARWAKEWRQRNPEKMRAEKAEYYLKNKHRLSEAGKATRPNVEREQPAEYECRTCKKVKPYTPEHFGVVSKYRWGLARSCKDCLYVRQLTYRSKADYGLTVAEVEALRGRGCDVCGSLKSVHIDHCHTTGKVRGPLCGSCNRALGILKEDAQRIRALALYAEINL